MHNISDKTSLLAVQGPKADEILQKLTDYDLSGLEYYTFAKSTFAGFDNVLISATGYTGSGGFELYFDKEHSEVIWNAIFEAGKEFDLQPIGLAARDTLRLEMGFCLYGNDIDDETSPVEAGLGWITRLKNEENQFIGRGKIEALKAAGIQRKLVGLEMIERGIPRQGYDVEDLEGNKIGRVTSGTMSPSLDKAIGMAYVAKGFSLEGSEVKIAIRQKRVLAKIVKPPFYKG
jgi:aminomethyltransferase